MNPGFAGGAYGYVGMGPYRGGQAEYLRVPFADFNCLPLPPGDGHEHDFATLADAYAALLRGASQVFVVDRVPGRLDLVKQMGATPIDHTSGSVPEQIAELTDGGTDKGIDAVGYQATAPDGQEQPAVVQPRTARPHPGRPGAAQLRGVQAGPAGSGTGSLRTFRPARGGLVEGRAGSVGLNPGERTVRGR